MFVFAIVVLLMRIKIPSTPSFPTQDRRAELEATGNMPTSNSMYFVIDSIAVVVDGVVFNKQ